VTRWEAFALLCDHLRAGLHGGKPSSVPGDPSWELLVEAASSHHVTPALACYAGPASAYPPDVSDYLDAVLTLNGQRNERILATLARVVAALNAIDVEPVLLKGAAHVVGGIYPSIAFRVLGDLDLLVPEDRANDAFESLRRIGFVPAGPPLPAGHHHLPMLCDPETEAGVELHTGVVQRRSEAIVPVPWFVEHTRAVAFCGTRARLPDATRTAAHIVVHDQLDHEGDKRARIDLRQLLDLAIIRARSDSALDWTELDRRFGAAGTGRALATYLHLAEAMLGQPMPRLRHAPRANAVARLRRAIEPRTGAWTRVTRVPLEYLAARRCDPLGLLNLLRPRTWRKGIQRLSEARAPRW
jgi:Uncharacterised nucleotidyltransferase